MQFDSLNREELQDVIFQLEQALYNHQQWYNSLIRSLICRLPPDRHDVSKDAHKECRFGQWYYGIAPKKLRKHQGFAALGEEHMKMHQESAKLLTKADNGSVIHPFDYDNFSNALQRVQLEISALQRELNEMLYTRDALTGAINRVNMLPILREQHAMVKRHLQACCLVMLDLDHFKKVNDQYGHLSGDYVLAWVSRFIVDHLRAYDKIFRVGGEEFLLCLQDTDTHKAFEIIDRLRGKIASSQIQIDEHKAINITISFGIAAIEMDISIEQAIEHADNALYNAKHSGRNCTKIWSKS
jgi:diguanylate cyclase (GGDEF)-like protein